MGRGRTYAPCRHAAVPAPAAPCVHRLPSFKPALGLIADWFPLCVSLLPLQVVHR